MGTGSLEVSLYSWEYCHPRLIKEQLKGGRLAKESRGMTGVHGDMKKEEAPQFT